MKIDDSKRARAALKTYFAKNAIPTADQFAQLIDSTLNQRDDGFVKGPSDPLSIEAVGDDIGYKKAINFYMSFADADPAWSISLRPRAVTGVPLSATPAWSVIDAAGNSRLAINAATGNVGIGTVTPNDKLEVAGRVRAGAMTIGPWPANPAGYVFVGSNFLDQSQPGNYALLQGTGIEGGTTYLNSPSHLNIRINNSDRVVVDSDVTLTASLNLASSDLYFTETAHNHTGRGNVLGHAAIENDGGAYNALMILGRNTQAGGFNRVVKLWDRLEIFGALDMHGDIAINDKHAFRGTGDGWLRLNQDGAYTAGTHTPGLFAPMSLNVGGFRGWATNPGNGSAFIAGDLLVGGHIGAMNLGPGPKTPGWGGGMHTYDLEVEATAWVRNGVQTGARDLAEIYFATDALEAGDVVALADHGDEAIAPTTAARDPRVIGIVSTEPGLLLGSLHFDEEPRDDGLLPHPVALLGCVPCKVTDEGGPIRRGDLLTTASRPGHAMRAAPDDQRPGTIIGKALGALAAGDGRIDVFVMLR